MTTRPITLAPYRVRVGDACRRAVRNIIDHTWGRHTWACLVIGLALSGCGPVEPNDLSKLPTVAMTIEGQPFDLWVAATSATRERGLMLIEAEAMTPLPDGTERGMIFVFSDERTLSFWMLDTYIPLDIAFLEADGTVTAIHTMTPLDTDLGKYTSGTPAMYAIEVNAGVFGDLDLLPGDVVDIPDAVLNLSP